jgi:hypothetical protein
VEIGGAAGEPGDEPGRPPRPRVALLVGVGMGLGLAIGAAIGAWALDDSDETVFNVRDLSCPADRWAAMSDVQLVPGTVPQSSAPIEEIARRAQLPTDGWEVVSDDGSAVRWKRVVDGRSTATVQATRTMEGWRVDELLFCA